jgi:hypothetical protein
VIYKNYAFLVLFSIYRITYAKSNVLEKFEATLTIVLWGSFCTNIYEINKSNKVDLYFFGFLKDKKGKINKWCNLIPNEKHFHKGEDDII